MAKKVFIAATGQDIGKTTICFSLMHLALKKYRRVGFIKPLGPKPTKVDGLVVDKDAALMAQVFGKLAELHNMSPVVVHPGTTRQMIDGEIDRQALEAKVLAAAAEIEKQCDFMIIEGSGHPGVGSILGLNNARMAKLLNAPVLMVTGGGLGNVVDGVTLNKALFEQAGVEVRAVLTNKVIPEKREQTLDYLRRAFAGEPFQVLGGFNYQPILANPTLRRISKILDLEVHGGQHEMQRIVHNVQIGAPSTQRVAELLKNDSLVIVTSSRDELLVTMANLYQFPDYHERIVGLLIPGVQKIGPITQQILDRSGIPYMRTTEATTAQLYLQINDDVSKLTAEDTEKIDLIRELAELRFDFDSIDKLFGVH
jgi:BioD-like phosphotransacetylase family protein